MKNCKLAFYLLLLVAVSYGKVRASMFLKGYSPIEYTIHSPSKIDTSTTVKTPTYGSVGSNKIDSSASDDESTFGFVGMNFMAYPFQAVGINAGVTDGEIGVRVSLFAGNRTGLEGGIFYTLYQKRNFEQQLTALFGFNRVISPSNDSTVSNKAIWVGPAYEITYDIFHASFGGVLYMEPLQQATKATFQPMFRLGIQYWFDE